MSNSPSQSRNPIERNVLKRSLLGCSAQYAEEDSVESPALTLNDILQPWMHYIASNNTLLSILHCTAIRLRQIKHLRTKSIRKRNKTNVKKHQKNKNENGKKW